MKKSKIKYKFQGGIQRIENDTPDYSKAYNFKAEQNAQNKGLSQAAGMFSGAYAPIGQVGGMGADVIRNRVKNKKTGSTVGGVVEMGTSGAALGAQLGGPWGAAAGAVIGGVYGGIKGAKDYDKIKAFAQEEEEKTRIANINKRYSEGTATDAQAALAKKGKYKVKTKQPRLIETEGREPIFSPKKADGTRDLLYYNPNDPTHEEGGVKAMVIPTAADGKKKTKVEKKPEPLIDKDSWSENVGEVFDPTGLLSWDDAYRELRNLKNNPKEVGSYTAAATEVLGALPLVGKLKYLAKTAQAARRLKRAGKFSNIGDYIGDITNLGSMILGEQLSNEGYNPVKGTYKGRNIGPQFFDKETAPAMGGVAFQSGAKQIKVNDLNNTAFSNNLANTPSANAPNAFIQPQAGINQVARQIPQKRRQEKIGFPKSYRKENPDTNRVITPPTRFDDRPKQPISGQNNNFKSGSSYIKTYQDGTQAAATYKHTKKFGNRQDFQNALKSHDDSLALHGQSRFFEDAINIGRKYYPTVETSSAKKYSRSSVSKGPDPNTDIIPFDYTVNGSPWGWGDPKAPGFERLISKDIQPIKTNIYTRKESTSKSEKEHNQKKNVNGNSFFYNVDMYKHPEMQPVFEPDTAQTIQPRKSKLKTSSDSTTNRIPTRTITTPTKETVADTTKTKTTPVANKPVTTRGKFVGREKTLLDKAGEFLNKVGSSKRMSNGKSVRVFK